MIGIDNSQEMINLASQRFINSSVQPELRIGSIEHLPMRDSEADCVVLNCVLHHSPNPSETVREINRALKPEKSLILVDFDKHDRENFCVDYGDLWLGFEKKTISTWLENAGFEIERYASMPIGNSMALHIIKSKKMRGTHDFEASA
jgi:2-polyprenyl-3-methyl-5-hydroxy-6-metoxy-1,4-benzoquinol methylase